MRIVLAILAIAISTCALAQEKTDYHKFNIFFSGGLGFGKVKCKDEPNYNLNTNNAQLLLNYKFSRIYGIATGISYAKMSGNGFNSMGSFHNERSSVKIPLLFTLGAVFNSKYSLDFHFGPYAQSAKTDEFTYIDFRQKDVYTNWNYGMHIGLHFMYRIDEHISFGVHYLGMSDLTTIEASGGLANPDKQLTEKQNSVGFSTQFSF